VLIVLQSGFGFGTLAYALVVEEVKEETQEIVLGWVYACLVFGLAMCAGIPVVFNRQISPL
jgi:hypothetical protein